MKNKLIIPGLLLVLTAVFLPNVAPLLWGAETPPKETLIKELNIHGPVRRIVAQNSDALEALRILNAENLVVGVMSRIDEEPEFWGDLVKLPHIGNWKEPNLEAVIDLDPDLVITYKTSPQKEWERKLAAHGIGLLRLDLYRLGKLEEEIRILGSIINKQAEAERFCSWHHHLYEDIQAKVARATSIPSVYVENYSNYIAAGAGTGGDELCTLAGGRNVSAVAKIPFPRVTPEWVVNQNPQVIIKSVSHYNGYELKTPAPLNARRDSIMNRPAWKHIDAVATGRVYTIDHSIWVGPRGIIGLAHMAKWFHPDIFQDLNPEVFHQQCFEQFMGKPYKGIYVSGPIVPSEK